MWVGFVCVADEYMERFKAIQFTQAECLSIVDVEDMYVTSLRTSLGDPNFIMVGGKKNRSAKRKRSLRKTVASEKRDGDSEDELKEEEQVGKHKKYSAEEEEFQE